MKRSGGGRTTPPGTPDPRHRKRIIATMGPPEESFEEIKALARRMGLPEPKAPPRSGRCMVCGNALVPPPAGPDRDHSVCHACFPPDMAEWEGKEVDYAGTTIHSDGRITVEEITPPPDPFVGGS